MELNASAGQEQRQRMDMSTWTGTVVAVTFGRPRDHSVQLFFTLSLFCPYNFLQKVSQTPILTKV